MTAKQLIELLSALDPETPVYLWDHEHRAPLQYVELAKIDGYQRAFTGDVLPAGAVLK